MSPRALGILIGALVAIAVHAALAAGYVAYRASDDLGMHARLGSAATHCGRAQPDRRRSPLVLEGAMPPTYSVARSRGLLEF